MAITYLSQTQIPTLLDFDVTDFSVVAEGVPEVGGVLQILDRSEAFTLQLKFKGEGTQWQNIVGVPGLTYEVHFDAEGIGPFPHKDLHLGQAIGNFIAGQMEYTAKLQVPNGISRDGVYRLAAMVHIPNWKGVLGFAEGLLMQVSESEE